MTPKFCFCYRPKAYKFIAASFYEAASTSTKNGLIFLPLLTGIPNLPNMIYVIQIEEECNAKDIPFKIVMCYSERKQKYVCS
jgi:hypothetical protein